MTDGPAPQETARHYENAHTRIVDLVRPLSDEQLATPVPAAPAWDVHDVLAHLTAIPTDALAGRLTGLPTDEFTAEQVRSRKGASVAELVEEWRGTVGQMCELAQAGLVPPNLAVDAVSHEQDIRGALRLPRVPDDDAISFCLDVYARGVCHRVRKSGAPPLRIVTTESGFDVVSHDGGSPVTVRGSEFELFRTLSGRRGRRDVLALDWDGDAEPYLAWLNVFGAVPDYDVVD